VLFCSTTDGHVILCVRYCNKKKHRYIKQTFRWGISNWSMFIFE